MITNSTSSGGSGRQPLNRPQEKTIQRVKLDPNTEGFSFTVSNGRIYAEYILTTPGYYFIEWDTTVSLYTDNQISTAFLTINFGNMPFKTLDGNYIGKALFFNGLLGAVDAAGSMYESAGLSQENTYVMFQHNLNMYAKAYVEVYDELVMVCSWFDI